MCIRFLKSNSHTLQTIIIGNILFFVHIAYEQNLERAAQIVTKAVQEDEKQNYKDAYHLYCEGLQYFVPIITAEEDANKREQLQGQAMRYMQRAEEIKRSAKQAYFLQRQTSTSQSQNVCTAETTSSETNSKTCTATENAVLAAINPTSSFKQLRKYLVALDETVQCAFD